MGESHQRELRRTLVSTILSLAWSPNGSEGKGVSQNSNCLNWSRKNQKLVVKKEGAKQAGKGGGIPQITCC